MDSPQLVVQENDVLVTRGHGRTFGGGKLGDLAKQGSHPLDGKSGKGYRPSPFHPIETHGTRWPITLLLVGAPPLTSIYLMDDFRPGDATRPH